MIITNSSMQLNSQHQAVEQDQRKESLEVWRGRRTDSFGNTSSPVRQSVVARQDNPSSVEISNKAQSLQPQKAILCPDEVELDEQTGDVKIQFLKLLIEKLTGRKIEVTKPADFESNHTAAEGMDESNGQVGTQSQSVGWGMVYDYYESHYESEQVSFQAEGVVHTSDGKSITVSIQLNMSREFFSEQSISIRAGDAVMKDPLVVNFNGTAAELTERNFSFDIDADGREDQISFVKQGSGLLALDRNGDGKINNGSELFGAVTGDGFSELAQFDQDGNGWIDEADSIYNRLRIWTKDADGHDRLMALGQSNIGAIYLESVDTPFLLKGDANQTLGQIRETGLYLSEEGSVGTLQQLDLVV